MSTGIQLDFQVSVADISESSQLYPRWTLCADTTGSKQNAFYAFQSSMPYLFIMKLSHNNTLFSIINNIVRASFEKVIDFDYHLQMLVQKFHYSVFHSTSLSVSCGKISRLDNELERRAATYTLWNQSTIKGKRRSWHPLTFDYADAAPQKLREIKVGNTKLKTSNNASNKTNHNLACSLLQLPSSLISQEIDHVYNEYEQHTEFCHTNSKVAPCFLFARKFTLGAAMRILREGLVGSYDVTAILPDI